MLLKCCSVLLYNTYIHNIIFNFKYYNEMLFISKIKGSNDLILMNYFWSN